MSFIDDYIKELKQDCPRLKDYNINADNYNSFLQMSQEDPINGESNPIKGYYHIANPNKDGNYTFTLIPCGRTKDEIKRQSIAKNLDTRFATDGYLKASFDDFRVNTEARKKALEYAKRFVKDYRKDNYMDGLYIHGNYGSGKTYLLSAIANELAMNGVKTAIVFFPDLCRELKRTMFKDDSEEIINDLKNVDVLVIDDFGAENLTAYIRDDVLGPILNYRWSMSKPFFIASNLSNQEIVEHLSHTKEDNYNNTVDSVKAARIYERIKNSTIDCVF